MSRKPFIALSVAEVLSLSGTRLSTIAIPWLVLSTTGDPLLTGFVALLEMLPYVVFKALGGPMIDRVGPRRVALVCDALSIVVVGLIPLLHALGALSMMVLLPLVFVMGMVRGPSDAAKQSMVPEVARLAAVPLERVTGVVGAIERLASTIGAVAAGGLIALIGPAEALTVNALTFALAVVVVWWGLPDTRPEREQAGEGSYRQQLVDGWSFLSRDAVLMSLVIMIACTNLLDQAYATVLVPMWAQQSGGGPEILGLVMALFSAASIGGALIAAMLGERLPRLPVYVIAFLLTGFPRFIVFAFDMPTLGIFATLAIAGFASGFLNPILTAVMFERIPKPLVGRVMSLEAAMCWALIPFGGLVGGAFIYLVGLPAAFIIFAVAYLLITLAPLMQKGFRGMARKPQIQTQG